MRTANRRAAAVNDDGRFHDCGLPLVELLARLAACSNKQLRRFVALAERFVLLELLDDRRGAERVGPEEQAALERREADAEDQREIDVADVGHDAFFEQARRFEQHRQEQAIGEIVFRSRCADAS